VILLTDSATGVPIHSAVYLAEELVFTKNGGNLKSSWVIMPMQDMFGLYLKEEDIKVSFFRKK